MYRVASKLIEQTWGDLPEIADALGVLLLTWNQAFYRYGDLHFDDLEDYLRSRWQDSRLAFSAYLRFVRKTKEQLENLGSPEDRASMERELRQQARFAKPLLKFLDENNYARYTQKDWLPSGA